MNYRGEAAKLKAASATQQSTSTAGSQTLATLSFAAGELQTGDILLIDAIFGATTPSGTEYWRIGLDDLTDTNACLRTTIGSNQSMHCDVMIAIESTTTAKTMRWNLAGGVGVSAAVDTVTIDTTTGVDLIFGCTLAAAAEIALEAYTVQHIKGS